MQPNPKGVNPLNQMMGVFKSTLKSAYKEAVSPHADRKMYDYFMNSLDVDYKELVRELSLFEGVSFIGRER